MGTGRLPSLLRKVINPLLVALVLAGPAAGANKYRVLYAFSGGQDGGTVYGGVAFDKQGNLYGTTGAGGGYNRGTVFELTPNADGSWTETVIHSFCSEKNCADGDDPWAGLVLDPDGNLYGATQWTLFEMSPSSGGWQFNVVYNGTGSRSLLLLDKAGNLYGAFGLSKGHGGAISELVRGSDGWKLRTLYAFCIQIPCIDGDSPNAVIWDPDGNLYGTTQLGGTGKTGDFGTVFELRHSSGGKWTHRVLHSFQSFQGDGELLYDTLVRDQAGNLYGTTAQGGKYGCGYVGCGAVFRLSRDSHGGWKETVLHSFKPGKNGSTPIGGVALDKEGNLYGATAGGGIGTCSGGCGVVFKLTPRSNGVWTYTVVHRFTGQDGANPVAAVTLDEKGNIYGTTWIQGPAGDGVVFEITP
jgi:uncharacterized repeat protein (TIGR03803 family)